MYCIQCEETTGGTACTVSGVCGKKPDVAAMEDLVVHAIKGLAPFAFAAAQAGVRDDVMDGLVLESLFTTVTNVNFDPDALEVYVRKLAEYKTEMRGVAATHGADFSGLNGATTWTPAADLMGLIGQGHLVSHKRVLDTLGEDIHSLQELLVYGIKGMAAYAFHARMLGYKDPAVSEFIYKAFDALNRGEADVNKLIGLNLECGAVNVGVMAMLDEANTTTYGHPVPTKVRMEPVKGKAILVSGHDLKDLEELLKQTEGKGVNIYTHSEMLPAHGYPELKKYPHLVGNYGGAWHTQQKEFEAFPGAILMTSNCIQKPRTSYEDRIFTAGPVGWPGITHVNGHDFTPVIERALACEGFSEDGGARTTMVGFGHNAVLGVAPVVVDAVKSGAIKHFFLVGGCDGHKKERSYYSDFVAGLPQDTVVLTLGCAKYRFINQDLGEIGGIPRVLDVGQCNDAYSAVRIAMALADAFETDINSLPLSMNISWYEQKATCILLSLLHLGVKNIHLGPTVPAYVSPGVLNVLVDKWGISGISTPEADMKKMMGQA
ncbi:MAG: hydroxylamine reductase [Deltaproteobacteria bacterium]|nr:hydroxylamine reductase [Deltaproteobacteria bacterium]